MLVQQIFDIINVVKHKQKPKTQIREEHVNMAKLESLGATVGEQIIIKGKVAFSEIAQRVEGEKLARKIERQEKLGMNFPQRKPHYSLSLVDVQVDPAYAGTPLAKYYGEKVYQNKDGEYALTLETTSKFPPRIYHGQEDGTAVVLEELPAELAVGQEVSVLIKTYASKQYSNMGSSFDAILLPAGEVKYYSNNASSEIEAFGLKPAENAAPVDSPESTPVDENDNPFGGNEKSETAETKAEPVDNVPADAKPEAPAGGVVTDNPFA